MRDSQAAMAVAGERHEVARKALVVEDDEAMAVALRDGLEMEGFAVKVARDGLAGLKCCLEERLDLVILDVMLPKMSGLDVCRRLRTEGQKVPVIMLTARGQEIDKVVGLKSGADDYVTKPFSFMELMARIEAVTRRVAPSTAKLDAFSFGDVRVSFARGELHKKGKRVEISPRELRLLEHLVAHRGEVVTRERLLSEVWGHDTGIFTRTVDMHVAKLRKKVEDQPSDPRFIITIHGSGYKFMG